MNKRIKIGSTAVMTLTDKHYLAAGGEAAVYKNGSDVYKIYHDEHKMLPLGKIKELRSITNPNVVRPVEIVYDADTAKPIGYSMKCVEDSQPLCKLFTKAFKQDNGVTPADIIEIVKAMQIIGGDVHRAKCLIVDWNELNVVVTLKDMMPWFIDTDSYATPSFRATAIMESIRDHKVKNQNFTELSDYFSWAVLAFQLYTNVHPYKGMHPKYKPAEWSKRMEDGVSVFDKAVKLPPVCNPFSVIPKRHLDWFKAVFVNGERSIPPLPDSSAPLGVPVGIVIIKGTDKFDVTEINSYDSAVLFTMVHFGALYVVTKNHVYREKAKIATLPTKLKKVLLSTANDGTVVLTSNSGGAKYTFSNAIDGTAIGTISGDGAFARNNAIYTAFAGRLSESTFTRFGSKVMHGAKGVANISATTSQVFDGCVVQDLLGKKFITIPYGLGRSCTKPIKELDSYRVLEAKSVKNFVVVIAEHQGAYSRFVITFDPSFALATYTIRQTKDVSYEAVNFTVTETGMCVLLSGQAEVEMIAPNGSIMTISNPPFDADMRLFSTPDGVFFSNEETVFQAKTK